MLKLIPEPRLRVPVLITVPGAEAPAKIEIEFKYLTKTTLGEYFAGYRDRPDVEALGHLILGWSDVDGPYSLENLALLLDAYPAAAGEIMTAYTAALLESRVKN